MATTSMMATRRWTALLATCCVLLMLACGTATARTAEDVVASTAPHNNWAVLVCTSRFWFNYRHIANTLSMYRTVKRLGIPDSNILLMLADDVACNPRNSLPAQVINNAQNRLDLYGDNVEVDYRGYEVTVESFVRLLTDRVDEHAPPSKRLLSDEHSNVFVFMTGHGGDEFLKFQDNEELSAQDLGDAIEQMWQKRRYKELFFMIDTCQANTMYSRIYSPNTISVGSSKIGTSSYSHHADSELGVAVIDRFTYYNLEVLEKLEPSSKATLQDLFDTYNPYNIRSEPGIRTDLFRRRLNETLVTEFLGAVRPVQLTTTTVDVAAVHVADKPEDAREDPTATAAPTAQLAVTDTDAASDGAQVVLADTAAATWTKSLMLWGAIVVLSMSAFNGGGIATPVRPPR
ncbi:glycosylphosphatidylinositol anchor biosynthesis [Sorochytrium milnesiophthora]